MRSAYAGLHIILCMEVVLLGIVFALRGQVGGLSLIHISMCIRDRGWPVGMQMGMETASFSLSVVIVGWLGTLALASHQIMLTISQFTFMMYYGCLLYTSRCV